MHGLILFAAMLGGLVVDERLPDVVYPPAQQTPPAAVKHCRDGCTCPKENCRCGDVAAVCDQVFAEAAIDESALKTVAAQAQEPTGTITVLTPAWCVGPCEWLKQQLGEGDALTKIKYETREAWWPLGPGESYPLMVDLQTLKKWSQDPRPGAKDVRPRTMDEARAKLGIAPQPKAHVVGLTVGTLPKAQIDLLRLALGESGRRKQGKEPLTHEAHGLTGVLPAGSVVEWNTAGGVLTLNFDKRPRVIFAGTVNQDLDRIVITADTLTFVLPWAPDVTFRLK